MLDAMTETVTLHRDTHTAEDVHGDPIGGSDVDVDVEGVLVAPNRGPGAEDTVGQTTSIDGMALYMPPGSPVPAPADAFTVRGERWQVKGRPGVWPDGIEVFLRKGD